MKMKALFFTMFIRKSNILIHFKHSGIFQNSSLPPKQSNSIKKTVCKVKSKLAFI